MVKKAKILRDIDEFALKKLEQASTVEENKSLSLEDFLPKCKKCTGKMQRLIPTIEMPNEKGILELHECEVCKEREYL